MKELTALAEKGEAAKAAFRDEAKKATAEVGSASRTRARIAAEEAFALSHRKRNRGARRARRRVERVFGGGERGR